MKPALTCQLVISGVGGQGVLFVTRLLAEAAIAKALPVCTSETHGMAQRGGTVVSHLKVGPFASPLITPGRADALMALKAETLSQYSHFLSPTGWAAVNSPGPVSHPAVSDICGVDADQLATQAGSPKSVNLIVLGFFLAMARKKQADHPFFCTVEDIQTILENRPGNTSRMLASSLAALSAGATAA
ncbi:2-oxoacid:acceptor oxidoreductase family protein [Desulfosarcina sp. OttesenSCG-928-G10]|nr:2-oxoacid:acceptor oxidoreductase family protein [Desulfosarcina sp. OttesenSCG-928-G10]MDL2321925.1 2-oxoacid:acceptor oxidoreductase family protein [Desulfosarcina sp. OttesenSCG-928-B08]